MATESGNQETSMLGFRCPRTMHKQFRMWCFENDIYIEDVLREIIASFLDENDELGKGLRQRALAKRG